MADRYFIQFKSSIIDDYLPNETHPAGLASLSELLSRQKKLIESYSEISQKSDDGWHADIKTVTGQSVYCCLQDFGHVWLLMLEKKTSIFQMFKRDTFDFEGFCTAFQSQLFLTDGLAEISDILGEPNLRNMSGVTPVTDLYFVSPKISQLDLIKCISKRFPDWKIAEKGEFLTDIRLDIDAENLIYIFIDFETEGFAFKISEDEKLAVVQNIGSMDVSALRITDQGDPAIDETKTALINALAEQMQVYRLEI